MVIGQYECGCTYGPITKKKRLEYCAVHGRDIQDEYPYFKPLRKEKDNGPGTD